MLQACPREARVAISLYSAVVVALSKGYVKQRKNDLSDMSQIGCFRQRCYAVNLTRHSRKTMVDSCVALETFAAGAAHGRFTTMISQMKNRR